MKARINILVSACLLGVNCRYDGTGTLHQELKDKMGDYNLIPVCPEQLGGMETPRQPSERVGAEIISTVGKDVTAKLLADHNIGVIGESKIQDIFKGLKAKP